MRNIKVSELKVGNVFTRSMSITNREAFEVVGIVDNCVIADSKNTGYPKEFYTDQEKLVILLKES